MTTPSKAKGDRFERAIADYLVSQGWKRAHRRGGAGATLDRGDINGIEGCCIEAKDEKRHDFSGYLRELAEETANAKADTGVVIVKKRGTTNVGEHYALMPVKVWVDLMKKAGYQ
jgi:Holliday junction resolvase